MRSLACAVSAIFFFPVCLWAGGPRLLVANVSSQVIQNARADADNLSRMHDTAMVQRFAQNGYLISVPLRARFYYLHAVPEPYRYCRPWTRLFLERLSRQYYAKFKQPLRITSLVRTVARQRQLASRNDNAADATGALQSSHLTGATLDISKHSMSARGRNWMRKVLYSLRQAGYLYAIEEFRQPVFHVMVYANYPQYAERLNRRAGESTVASSGAPTAEEREQ